MNSIESFGIIACNKGTPSWLTSIRKSTLLQLQPSLRKHDLLPRHRAAVLPRERAVRLLRDHRRSSLNGAYDELDCRSDDCFDVIESYAGVGLCAGADCGVNYLEKSPGRVGTVGCVMDGRCSVCDLCCAS